MLLGRAGSSAHRKAGLLVGARVLDVDRLPVRGVAVLVDRTCTAAELGGVTDAVVHGTLAFGSVTRNGVDVAAAHPGAKAVAGFGRAKISTSVPILCRLVAE
jgi:hypothetical protein